MTASVSTNVRAPLVSHPLGMVAVIMVVLALVVNSSTAVAVGMSSAQAFDLFGQNLFSLPSEQWPPSVAVYIAIGLLSVGIGLVGVVLGLLAALRKGCRWCGWTAVVVGIAIAPVACGMYVLAGGVV